MKTGVELIAQERREQVEKHGFTIESQREWNSKKELVEAAKYCIDSSSGLPEDKLQYPYNWDHWFYLKVREKRQRLSNKDFQVEMLKIAGAFCAAEIDRLNDFENELGINHEKISEAQFNSAEYWEKRYASGGNSGAGSSRQLAAFKGEFIGKFMYEHLILSVIDWGCGDGAQIQYLQWNTTLPFPKYIGLDVSKTSIEKCKQFQFNPEYFKFMTTGEYNGEQAELGLSLDVIYHLVEDDVFERYMQRLCDSATKYLVIYSSDGGKVENPAQHLKERCFTEWIKEHRPEWELIRYVANVFPYRGGVTHEESISDFYIYKRTNSGNDLP
jgi:SAM-dependent methyltransferase